MAATNDGSPPGLEISASCPTTTVKADSVVTVSLKFKNSGPGSLRLYFLRSEPFRAMQSSFAVSAEPRGRFLSLQPEPRPHGIVVGEHDFFLLEKGEEATREQAVRIPSKGALDGDAAVGLLWSYANKVESWPGNIQTLDGPTRELFGGATIPFIWTGKSQAPKLVLEIK
jgi:hypothetical protein